MGSKSQTIEEIRCATLIKQSPVLGCGFMFVSETKRPSTRSLRAPSLPSEQIRWVLLLKYQSSDEYFLQSPLDSTQIQQHSLLVSFSLYGTTPANTPLEIDIRILFELRRKIWKSANKSDYFRNIYTELISSKRHEYEKWLIPVKLSCPWNLLSQLPSSLLAISIS